MFGLRIIVTGLALAIVLMIIVKGGERARTSGAASPGELVTDLSATAVPPTISGNSKPVAAHRQYVQAPHAPPEPEQLPETSTVAEILAQIDALLASRTQDSRRYAELLAQLVAIESPEAWDAGLNLMTDPSLQFPQKAKVFSEVLAGRGIPGVANAAIAAYEVARSLGYEWPADAGDYLILVASEGGAIGSDYLIGLLNGTDVRQARQASSYLQYVQDRSVVIGLLGSIGSSNATSQEQLMIWPSIITDVSHLEDPAVARCILDIARNGMLDVNLRAEAYASVAGSAHSIVDVQGYVQDFLSATNPQDRWLSATGLEGLREDRFDASELGEELFPMLSLGLRDQDEQVWEAAVAYLHSNPGLASRDLLPDLYNLLSVANEEQRGLLRGVIIQLEAHSAGR